MPPTIRRIPVPPSSILHDRLPDADFHDAYEMALGHRGRPALAIYLDMVGRTPAWVERLMAARNRIVALLGLKDLGHLGQADRSKPAADYRIGDRVGIFSLLHLSDDEIVLGDSDRHLDVLVSLCKLAHGGRESVATTTVVHIHNLLGHAYMLLVVPFHRRIAPAVLKQAADRA